MNYQVTNCTAKLVEAADVLVKANDRVFKLFEEAYGNDYPDELTEAYGEAIAKAKDEVMNLIRDSIAENLHSVKYEEVLTEI